MITLSYIQGLKGRVAISDLLIVSIIEFTVICLSIFYLQKIKLNLFSVSISLSIAVISLVSFYFLESWIAIIILFGSIVLALIFHSNLFKICIDLCLIIFIGMISDHIAQLVLNKNNNVFFHSLIFALCYAILFIIINLLINLYKRDYLPINFITKFLISILCCVTVIVLYLNIFIPTSYEELRLTRINLIIQICYLIVMSFLFILLIYSINETNKLKHEKIQKALFSQYMSSLNEINIEMQKFRHDYKNILITMERYIDNKDLDGLKKYFKEKIINTEKNTLLKNALIHDLGNLELMELKGLLLTKLLTAVEKKIDIQIEIPEKIDSIYMDIIDLSRMIGILIDNAIEASIECENPFINLAIMKTNDNSVLMIIENNFTNTLDIHQLYKNHYSTKKGNRGYGLNNVKDILNNYPNVLMNTSIEENIFIQEIEIR